MSLCFKTFVYGPSRTRVEHKEELKAITTNLAFNILEWYGIKQNIEEIIYIKIIENAIK